MPFDSVPYDANAFAQNENAAKEMERLLEQVLEEVVKTVYNVPHQKRIFRFSTFPALDKNVNSMLSLFVKAAGASINRNTLAAWTLAHAKNDKLIDYMHKQTGIDKELIRRRYQYGLRNLEGLKAFQTRKINGLRLSNRIWEIAKGFKNEMETAIDVSLTEGSSARQLSRAIKPLLKDPDLLFRRVRDKHKKLVPSKAAKNYHPGRGVYRSASKNAMRLARTEINMAYREADNERWSKMDFVKGIDVRLSNNPRHCPVCETLKGVYPKEFTFIGWHPQCRCFAVPVLLTPAEYSEYERALLKGKKYEPSSAVSKIPEAAKKWWKENGSRTRPGKDVPYFIKDNPRFFK